MLKHISTPSLARVVFEWLRTFFLTNRLKWVGRQIDGTWRTVPERDSRIIYKRPSPNRIAFENSASMSWTKSNGALQAELWLRQHRCCILSLWLQGSGVVLRRSHSTFEKSRSLLPTPSSESSNARCEVKLSAQDSKL